MRKRIISVLMAAILLLALMPDVALTAYAANTYCINGVNIRFNNFTSESGECWAYANNFYNNFMYWL